MDEKKGNTRLKIAIFVLATFLVGLVFYTFQFYNESQSNQTILTQEKIELQRELHDLLSKYEEVKTTNKRLEQDFIKAQRKIKHLLDSMKEMEVNYVFMHQYKKQVSSLRQQKQALFRTVDSVSAQNKALRNTIDSTKTELVQTVKDKDSLVLENEKLEQQVSLASKLKITGVTVNGKRMQDDEETENSFRASRTKDLEICFDLDKNELADTGGKHFFIQIIDPENNLLGEKSTITFGAAVLNYSKNSSVHYENQAMEICEPIATEHYDFKKGRYLVNIFLEKELLYSNRFVLE